MIQPQTQYLDFYRAGLRTTADLMKATLESTERVQAQQLNAVRSALEESTRAADRLADAQGFDELMAVQARMARAQVERAVSLWSTVVRESWGFGARAAEDAGRMASSQLSTVGSAMREGAHQAERKTQERKSA